MSLPYYVQGLVDNLHALAQKAGLVTVKPQTEAGLQVFLDTINEHLRNGQINAQEYTDTCLEWLQDIPETIKSQLWANDMRNNIVNIICAVIVVGVVASVVVNYLNSTLKQPNDPMRPPQSRSPALAHRGGTAAKQIEAQKQKNGDDIAAGAESADMQAASAIVKNIVDDNDGRVTEDAETHQMNTAGDSDSGDEIDTDAQVRIGLAALTLTSGEGTDVNALIFSTPRSSSASPSPAPSPRSIDEQLQIEAQARPTKLTSITLTSATIEDDGPGNERSRTPSPR